VRLSSRRRVGLSSSLTKPGRAGKSRQWFAWNDGEAVRMVQRSAHHLYLVLRFGCTASKAGPA
jgi:hypothetical protein